MHVETLSWTGERGGHVRMIEQTLLPARHVVIDVRSVEEMVAAIRRLAVRGAPALGVAAAYGLLLGVQDSAATDTARLLGEVRETAATLAKSRPTAVNLFWALDRMVARATREMEAGAPAGEIIDALFEEAFAIHESDRETCRRIGEVGAELLQDGWRILTHCNAGALATGGMGTALSPIYTAVQQGKRLSVLADETRPLLQGARLTTWELLQAGIETTLITDNTAGWAMSKGRVDAVIVGADRIARNGDVCNKIGTYSVAVLADRHGIPFYVAAPLSTFDPALATGDMIPIEERAAEEVTEGFGLPTAPAGVRVFSPAFDVTPHGLVAGIITEVGLVSSPDTARVEEALRRGGRLD